MFSGHSGSSRRFISVWTTSAGREPWCSLRGSAAVIVACCSSKIRAARLLQKRKEKKKQQRRRTGSDQSTHPQNKKQNKPKIKQKVSHLDSLQHALLSFLQENKPPEVWVFSGLSWDALQIRCVKSPCLRSAARAADFGKLLRFFFFIFIYFFIYLWVKTEQLRLSAESLNPEQLPGGGSGPGSCLVGSFISRPDPREGLSESAGHWRAERLRQDNPSSPLSLFPLLSFPLTLSLTPTLILLCPLSLCFTQISKYIYTFWNKSLVSPRVFYTSTCSLIVFLFLCVERDRACACVQNSPGHRIKNENKNVVIKNFNFVENCLWIMN